jgi:hypothetical protein
LGRGNTTLPIFPFSIPIVSVKKIPKYTPGFLILKKKN